MLVNKANYFERNEWVEPGSIKTFAFIPKVFICIKTYALIPTDIFDIASAFY